MFSKFQASQTLNIPPGQVARMRLPLAWPILPGYCVQPASWPGLAKRGFWVPSGVIPPGSRQTVKILLLNSTEHPFQVQKGQRVGRALLLVHHGITYLSPAQCQLDDTADDPNPPQK